MKLIKLILSVYVLSTIVGCSVGDSEKEFFSGATGCPPSEIRVTERNDDFLRMLLESPVSTYKVECRGVTFRCSRNERNLQCTRQK